MEEKTITITPDKFADACAKATNKLLDKVENKNVVSLLSMYSMMYSGEVACNLFDEEEGETYDA